MSNSHRSHRRRKKHSAGRLGLAGALTGVLGIAAVAGGIMVVRHTSDGGGSTPPSLTSQVGGTGGLSVAAAPKGGPAQSFTTPEGYGYDLSAVKTGTDARPLSGSTPPPSGSSYAYADYVLTNNQRRPVLLDFPSDLFVPLSQVPGSARERCMPQPGIPEHMCTLPNHSEVTARLNGSKAPIEEDGEKLMPAGASYLVRIAADLPVKDGLDAADLKLYVWDARFTSDRKGVEIAFP
ncbi:MULTISPECIES: hypothetical protein [Thermomonosporaceae]|uniref:hypothetical protein n=1 Tax=Thermomonosporaceae TaxID=2012 RepID=UPI00255AA35B|nr:MULTISPECIES: hypothetical protein [Thermomonosporaceae]MDL4771418.1 hypothetical protein [Actinomadura xylanilytica]